MCFILLLHFQIYEISVDLAYAYAQEKRKERGREAEASEKQESEREKCMHALEEGMSGAKISDKNKMPTLSRDDCIEDDNACIYL